MISDGVQLDHVAPQVSSSYLGLTLVLTVLSINLFGEGVARCA